MKFQAPINIQDSNIKYQENTNIEIRNTLSLQTKGLLAY